MEHRSKLSYWDRAELLETVKETYQQLHGVRPKPGLYDELEIGEYASLHRGMIAEADLLEQ